MSSLSSLSSCKLRTAALLLKTFESLWIKAGQGLVLMFSNSFTGGGGPEVTSKEMGCQLVAGGFLWNGTVCLSTWYMINNRGRRGKEELGDTLDVNN